MLTPHPQLVLEQLVANAKGLKRKNLNLLQTICDEHFKTKAVDFSLATIGRLSERAGGISRKALYNATSADYQALIRAWAAFSAGGKAHLSKVPTPLQDNGLLLQIPDPAVRALVGAAFAERNRLRSEVTLLKRSTNIVVDRRTCAPSTPVTVVNGSEIYAPAPTLTDSERRALKKAASPTFLSGESWTEGVSGEVKNGRGRTLFDPGFLTALRKVLGETHGDGS
ncbi:gamma-mobile-trio protein GmtX [Paraburkholderia graminis]|uniref:Alpha/beta hydrolase fold n=1 Tax=Paraburkholderia graminis TaxID=60548 RepID=A0ABD5CKN6_9BURK|nr:gamma-mobile-trio protein GmtX [Paraburkholderia graminis]MDR6205426.1 hypothetical protein [Paraburkholderia graminis]